MAKLPRPSGKEMLRLLERMGFTVVRIRGSHHFLQRGDKRTCVPVHGNSAMKIGTLRSVLRDIDLSPQEFEQRWQEIG
jgi:predicted RNA binding protein YcfA (HicA-like mRNA interferase family)